MKFLIVEDDYLQADSLEAALQTSYPECEIIHIRTEHEFLARLEDLKIDRPDLALIDVMLRWSDPAVEMPEPPAQVKEEGYYRAGLRCMWRLREFEETKDIPVIFYTVLQETDTAEEKIRDLPNTYFIRKDTDPDDLFDRIELILGPQPVSTQ